MKNMIKMSLATAVMMSVGTVSAQAAEEGISIFEDIKFKGQLRPRFEHLDNSGLNKSAGNILTNRTNLNLQAKLLGVEGLTATVEVNAVNDFSTLDQTTSQTGGTEVDAAKVSQANISYTSGDATGIVGRKTVNIDNQRFVGSVGWKQNFQTLDIVAGAYNTDKFNILAAYVYGVNAIGDAGNGTAGNLYTGGTASGETTSAVVNASFKAMDALKVTGYVYALGSHSNTYGVAATGGIPISEGIKLNYRAEFAKQTDASLETKSLGKPTNDSSYINIDVNTNISDFLVGLNYEVLGADKTDGATSVGGFQTPLATKHKFNGFADVFLGTPGQGLKDFNLMLGYKTKSFGLAKLIAHSFKSDEGSIDYGTEIDLLYKRAIPGVKGVTGLFKLASYQAGDSSANGNPAKQSNDVSKVWLMLDYKFSN